MMLRVRQALAGCRAVGKRRWIGRLSLLGLAMASGVTAAHFFVQDGSLQKTASVPAETKVLQSSSDWLSESYWQRKRRKKATQRRARANHLGVPTNPFAQPFGFPGFGSERKRRGSGAARSSGGTYRTVCVRLCDGYYFPVSFSTTRGQLAKDDRKCRSSCSGGARLFYYRNSDGSPDTMKDRRGRAYKNLKTAFLYRTTYNKSCQCRPDPWSEEAKQRHAMYRQKGWKRKARRLARLEAKRARAASREAGRQHRFVKGRVTKQAAAPAGIAVSESTVNQIAPPGATGLARVVITQNGQAIASSGRRARQARFSRGRMSLGRRPAAVNRPTARPRVVRRKRRRRTWKSQVFSTDR